MDIENYNKVKFEGEIISYLYASLSRFRENNPAWTTDILIVGHDWGTSITVNLYHPTLINIIPEYLSLKFPTEVSDELVYKQQISQKVTSFNSKLLII